MDSQLWLFRQDGALMGPVPGAVIIERLEAGDIGPDTLVADEDGERWVALREVKSFAVHIARAEARQRVMADKAKKDAVARRRSRVRGVLLFVVAGIVVAGAGGGAWYWVTHRDRGEQVQELADIGITLSPPVIALASASPRGARGADWVDVDVGEDPQAEATKTGTTPRPTRSPGKGKPPAGADARALAAKGSEPPPSDDVGTVRNYDMAHINGVVAQESRTLFPCIKDEVRRTGFRGQIPFEFVIKNDGRVGRLWIDAKELRGTPMEQCFQNTMKKWRFNPFVGERPTVSQSFTIGG